jgi:hypothetical protein
LINLTFCRVGYEKRDVPALKDLTVTKATILQVVQEMERKLAELRRAAEQLPELAESTSASAAYALGSVDTGVERLPVVQFVDKARLRPTITQAFAQMGIRAKPIGAEKVQEMMESCGVKPENNVFSQGIIEMREE